MPVGVIAPIVPAGAVCVPVKVGCETVPAGVKGVPVKVDVVAPPLKVAVRVEVTIVSDPARAIVQSLLPVLMNL